MKKHTLTECAFFYPIPDILEKETPYGYTQQSIASAHSFNGRSQVLSDVVARRFGPCHHLLLCSDLMVGAGQCTALLNSVNPLLPLYIVRFVDSLLAFGYIVGERSRAGTEDTVFSNAALTVGAS